MGSFQVGDRVEACQLLSWTVDEFEDFPLIVQEGERGKITGIESEIVYIDWDKDRFKHMPKCINLSLRTSLPVKTVE